MNNTVMGQTQETLTLRHLQSVGSITGVEAETIYKIRHLPKRIQNLKAKGHDIISIHKKDFLGQRYVSYELRAAPPKASAQDELFSLAA